MRWGLGGSGVVRVVLAVALLAAVALAVAQLVLPRIAASRVSSRLGRFGRVERVHVSAWPAIEILWGQLGSVTAQAGPLTLSSADAAKLLWEARGAERLDASVGRVTVGGLRLQDAHVRKRGSSLLAEGLIDEGDVAAALPPGVRVTLAGSGGGIVRVRASGGLFGLRAGLLVAAGASEGKLIARPVARLLGGFSLTLFSDPHVYVEGVGASVVETRPLTYRLTMSARLH